MEVGAVVMGEGVELADMDVVESPVANRAKLSHLPAASSLLQPELSPFLPVLMSIQPATLSVTGRAIGPVVPPPGMNLVRQSSILPLVGPRRRSSLPRIWQLRNKKKLSPYKRKKKSLSVAPLQLSRKI